MSAILVPPDQARSVRLAGLGVVFKISAEQTNGMLSIVEHPIDARVLVPPHMHTREDELSYVLEGEIGARIGDQVFRAGPGSYLFKPRGIPHTFWNPTDKPARLIEIITPGGFEKYFEELAELIKSGGLPGGKEHVELNTRYGNTNDGMEWMPELIAKYGLIPPAPPMSR